MLRGEAPSVRNLRIVVSLPNDNAYQHEQGVVAKSTAAQLGVELEVVYANDEAIIQSQQLLQRIQTSPEKRPTAFIVEPVTAAGLKRVAEEAVAARIAWVVSNNEVDYVKQLRAKNEVPVFIVTQGQHEIGRLQGKQIAALLPHGGLILYIEGPSTSAVAKQRREGMESARPTEVKVMTLRSKWSTESAFESVTAWLRLATSRAEKFNLVAGQTHELALGANKALGMVQNPEQKQRWMDKPYLGIGVANQVKPLVDKKLLRVAVLTSTTMAPAVSLLVQAIRDKKQVPDCTVVEAGSYPGLEKL